LNLRPPRPERGALPWRGPARKNPVQFLFNYVGAPCSCKFLQNINVMLARPKRFELLTLDTQSGAFSAKLESPCASPARAFAGQRRDEETLRDRPVPLTPEDCGDQDQAEEWHHASLLRARYEPGPMLHKLAAGFEMIGAQIGRV
jgi:hypothetical protein